MPTHRPLFHGGVVRRRRSSSHQKYAERHLLQCFPESLGGIGSVFLNTKCLVGITRYGSPLCARYGRVRFLKLRYR